MGQIKISPYGNNGAMTEVMHYRIDGQKIFETIDIDLNSPTYGQTLKVEAKQGGPLSKRTEVSPNSELGRAIVADLNSTRQTAYINEMSFIGGKAEKNGFGNVHNEALKNSGMYAMANGDAPFEVNLPAVEYVIEGDVTISEEKDDNNNNQNNNNTQKPRKPFFGGKAVKYPANAIYKSKGGPSQDYMKIDMFKYVAPQSTYMSGYFDEKFDDAKIGGAGSPSFSDTILGGLQRNSAIESNKQKRNYLGTVKLPIPNQLETSNGVSWGEGTANAFEAAAFMGTFGGIRNAISGDTTVAGLLGSTAKTGTELLGDLAKGEGKDANTLLSAVAARTALSKININVDTNQFVTRSTGKAINPNLELLFAGPRLRSFQFSFNFAPQNPEDAKNARKIQRFFKEGMLPRRGQDSDLYLLSPNVFRLAFMNNGQRIKSLNAFKICALTNCAINFTPDGMYQAYDDPVAISQPIRSIMTLGFTELSPILADDYDTEAARPSILALQDKVLDEGPLDQFFDDSTGDEGIDIGF